MEFKDKRVLVTGSSRGIGFAAAQRFLEGGARVVINGRSEAGVKAAAEALGQRDRALVLERISPLSRVASTWCLRQSRSWVASMC